MCTPPLDGTSGSGRRGRRTSGTPPLARFQHLPHAIFHCLVESTRQRIRKSTCLEHKSHGFDPSLTAVSSPSPSLTASAPRFALFAALTAFLFALRWSFLASALDAPCESPSFSERAPSTSSSSPSFPAPAVPFAFFLFALQLLLQVVTSSQHCSHFFLHVNGRSHTTHTLVGRFSFFTPRVIASFLYFPEDPRPRAVTQRLARRPRVGDAHAALRTRGAPTKHVVARKAAFAKRTLASMDATRCDGHVEDKFIVPTSRKQSRRKLKPATRNWFQNEHPTRDGSSPRALVATLVGRSHSLRSHGTSLLKNISAITRQGHTDPTPPASFPGTRSVRLFWQ